MRKQMGIWSTRDNHKEVFVSVVRWKRAFRVVVDPLEWLSNFDEGNLLWAMELKFTLTTNREPACHLLDLIERIRQVLGLQKVV